MPRSSRVTRAPIVSVTGVYRSWSIAFTAMGALAAGSGVSFWAFGHYFEPLERDLGWGRSHISGGVSVTWALFALAGPAAGWWVDRFGVRSAFVAGAIVTSAAYLLLAGASHLWQWYLLLGLAGLARAYLMNVPVQALVARWFQSRRGQAMSLAAAGFGVGGFIFTPLLAYIVDASGWRHALIVSAFAVLAYFVPVALLIVRDFPCQEAEASACTQPRPAATLPVQVGRGCSIAQAVRTPLFWAIAVGQALLQLGQLSFMLQAVPILQSEGLSARSASTVVMVISGLYTGLRLGAGFLADRISPRSLGVAVAVLQAAALVLVLGGSSLATLALFTVLWSLGQASGWVVEPLLLARYFAGSDFGKIIGTSSMISNVGLALGPAIGGLLYDKFGNYDAAIALLIGALLGAAACYLLLSPLERLSRGALARLHPGAS